MRALFVSLLIPLLAACSTMAPAPSASPSMSDVNLSGRWTGTWIGTGLFNSPREDAITLDLRQPGKAGYGRLVFEGTTAAESVPWDVRREGLAGIRVGTRISGSGLRVKHEMGGRFFAANFTMLDEDRMVGEVEGAPNVRMLLTRAGHKDTPQAQATPTPSGPSVAAKPEPLAKIEPAPELNEAKEPDPVQIAKVMPSEEPQSDEQTTERPRVDEFIAVPELKTVYFDFDKATVRPDAADTLGANAEWLLENTDTLLLIEGYCDERGTTEYNQALGDRRAQSVKESLEASGVDPDRMTTISYGKERPVCTENTEDCHRQNRHVEFRVKTR